MALPISKDYLLTQLRNFKSVILDPAYTIQKTSLPTASSANEGAIFQYIGSASGMTVGGFYQCQEITPATDPKTYHWVEVSTKTLIDDETIKRDDTTKELYVPKGSSSALGVFKAGGGLSADSDGVLSADVNVFNGTIDEFEALTAEQQAKYSHIASPDEATADGDTEWVTIEKTSAVASGVIKAMRKGNIVTVSFNNVEATVTNYDCTLVTALPTKYRPPSGAGLVMSICGENPNNSNAVVLASCYISNAGVVQLQSPHIQNGTIKYASAVMTYPAGY